MGEETIKVDDVDWKAEYIAKRTLMEGRGYAPTDPYVFYRELFPEGCLSNGKKNDGKGSAILTQIRKTDAFTRSRQYIVNDNLNALKFLIGDEFGLLPPLSFYGKSHKKKNAHELYAYAIDIDYVGEKQLRNLLAQFKNGARLCPTYLVSSGKGVHLYYFLDSPIALYHYREEMLSELKKEMIKWLWNEYTSLKPNDPDITGIYQGFRGVGSLTKFKDDFSVVAYKMCDKRYNVYELKESMPYSTVDLSGFEVWIPPKDDHVTTPIDQAKELWPEWYEKRIVKKEEPEETERGSDGHSWVCKPALYEWWKRKIYTEARVGGRYFCIYALCAYGLKCGIPDEQIKEDAYSFQDYLESLTETEDNHFLSSDIRDALASLNGEKRTQTRLTTRQWVEDHTKISIPINKRNGYDQKTHLEYARGIRALKKARGEKVSGDGRPTVQRRVLDWRTQHPDGTKTQCHNDTNMSMTTIRKWWDTKLSMSSLTKEELEALMTDSED